MTLERLRDLLDAYGASPGRWPDAERAEAIRLIAESADANALYEAATELDLLLDADSETEAPSRSLIARVLGGAPIPKSSRVAALRATRRLAIAVPLAAAAAVAIWLAMSNTPSETPQVATLPNNPSLPSLPSAPTVLTAPAETPTPPTLPPAVAKPLAPTDDAEVARVEVVEYTSATDVLLSSYGVDVYTVTPSVGCEASELGCPKIQDQENSQSELPTENRPIV